MVTASAGLCGAVFGLIAEHAGNFCSPNLFLVVGMCSRINLDFCVYNDSMSFLVFETVISGSIFFL